MSQDAAIQTAENKTQHLLHTSVQSASLRDTESHNY